MNCKPLGKTKSQAIFRQRIAKQFDKLVDTLQQRGPFTFRRDVVALRRIGYSVIARAAEQREVGL